MYRNAMVAVAACGLIACANRAEPTKAPSTPKTKSPASSASSESASNPSDDQVVATWTGGKMTYGELVEKHSSEFRKMRNKFKSDMYNFERQRVEASVVQSLVQAAAKAKGQSEDDYLKGEVGNVEVSDEEVKKFHAGNPQISSQPLEQFAPRIKQYLEQQKKQQKMVAVFQRLKDEAGVKITLARPQLEKASFELAGRPSKGKADAKITVVEFSDFQCPYCSRAVSGVEALLKAYPEDVRVVFMHFPLNFHKEAMPAAIASQCANQQGKFWAFHDKVFANQAQLTPSVFESYAKDAKLDLEKFKSCIADPATAAFVQNDMEQGTNAGVEGTPSFFINGEPYTQGVPTPDAIKAYLEG